jgi:hypothetical protein
MEKKYVEKIKNEEKEEKKKLKAELKWIVDELILKAKKEVKTAFNYPIFMAEVENSWITSTGATDVEWDELPLVIEEYRKFQKELFNYQEK